MASKESLIGWYMYTPFDLKKAKVVLRWVTVKDYWLEISTKRADSPILSFHLGFCEVFPPPKEENQPINSLYIQTKAIHGDYQCLIYTHNRFDILDLSMEIKRGKERWNKLCSEGLEDLSFDSSFKDKNSVLLGGRNVEFHVLDGEISMTRSQSDKSTFGLDNINYIRPVRFDTRQGSCFEMNLKQGAKSDLIFQCHDHEEMKRFVNLIYFLMNLKTC